MGAISDAIASACRSAGVEIEINAPVRELIVEKGRAAGVVLANGKIIRSTAVAANVNPKLLYTGMIAKEALDPAFLAHMRNWRCASGTFRMNLALSELPSFTACPGHDLQDHHTAGIILGPSLHYMDRAYCEARLFGWSRAPVIEMVIPSTLDDSLAPRGKHVASLFCQYVAPQLPDGRSWTEHREQVADLMIDTVERYAPGFKSSIIDRQALSPLDLEQVFGLVGGDIFHGALTLDQLFWARPAIGYADYRGPLAGLYHCGSGAHPGGGVTGAPGHNAARAILEDCRGRSRSAKA
jgi:phytoene dehydrogenase-like protein